MTEESVESTGRHDEGLTADWGRTSADYATHRPGPPDSFYARLTSLGIGVEGQRVLDLATGTGLLARRFARQGATVHGIDISEEQIATARRLSAEEGLNASRIDFSVGRAESLPWTEGAFDVATANQCWLYFEKERVVEELRRVLGAEGRFVTSHFSWVPRLDPIAGATEELVLSFNPKWSSADWSGDVPECPGWAKGLVEVADWFVYDEPIPFTHESWRGRIRACRGIGATLSDDEVAAFDRSHAKLLERTVPDTFTVLHRIDAHVFTFRE